MKAATRSGSKGSRRRGRPCTQNVARTESGRISRAANANEAPDKLAKEVRMRMHGLTRDDAAQPEAGSVIGRMKLAGDLSTNQYDALISYMMTRERYMIAIRAPDSLKTRRGGVMAVASEDADGSAVAAWDRVQRVIRDAQAYETGNLAAALQFMVIRDEHHPHMVGDLRTVANALFRHYGVAKKSKSA